MCVSHSWQWRQVCLVSVGPTLSVGSPFLLWPHGGALMSFVSFGTLHSPHLFPPHTHNYTRLGTKTECLKFVYRALQNINKIQCIIRKKDRERLTVSPPASGHTFSNPDSTHVINDLRANTHNETLSETGGVQQKQREWVRQVFNARRPYTNKTGVPKLST